MPKVTFIFRDGTKKTVEFEHGKMPFQEHGLPESQCKKCNPDLEIVRPPPGS